MRAIYDDVTQWVRLHAWATFAELRVLNSGAVLPLTSPFLRVAAEGQGVVDDSRVDAFASLTGVEEITGVMWLLDREHVQLLERITELFGSRAPLTLPAAVDGLLARAQTPALAISTVGASIAARVRLLASMDTRVDAHTRLVLREHSRALAGAVSSALSCVQALVAHGVVAPEGDGVAAVDVAFATAYQTLAPLDRRQHPETFQQVSLLRGAS